MGVGFRRFSKKKSDASPARKYSTGSQHDSSASQDSSSSHSASLHAPENSVDRTEVGNIVRSCIQQLKSQQEDQAFDALKSLFALSSPEDTGSRQRDMICVLGGALLPVLFSYIDTAEGVYIQTALLVVNNLSTVAENKRPLAMQGAGILARVLTRDPSCHLAAIILVNLTFCDAELRRDLVLTKEFNLVETLALTLLICSMDELEFCSKGEPRLSLPPGMALKELLSDQDMVFAIGDASSPSKPCYPNTLKWAISALKNLTRPSKYDNVAHAVLESGIVPHILRLAALKDSGNEEWSLVQDAALYSIVHLTAIPSARPQLREVVPPALAVLTPSTFTGQETEKALFQRVKARIALAYLCGSEGHYGQPVCPRHMREGNENAAASSHGDVDSSSHLQMNDAEAEQLLELLTNMLHQRSKDGPAGYSSSTFSVKYVLFAIRCLLTQTHNQSCIANIQALQCNTLLIKAVAMHLWQPDVIHLDPEAAEHAIFSLYLMSNHGFRVSAIL